MTDTVNVPQEMIDAVMKVAVGVDEYGSEVFPGPFVAAELVRATLAAAPKAEPVSDPYKLDLESVRSKLSEVVDCSRALRQGGPDPEDLEELSDALDRATSIADDILASVVWSDPSVSVQLLSNPQQLPEAPKVEQEPVAWIARNYDLQRMGVTQCRDEMERHEQSGWEIEPLYTHPATASDELLDAAEYAVERFGMWKAPTANMEEALELLRDAIAKHKGPQS